MFGAPRAHRSAPRSRPRCLAPLHRLLHPPYARWLAPPLPLLTRTTTARGEADDKDEAYEVDFFRKAYMEPGTQPGPSSRRDQYQDPVDTAGLAVGGSGAQGTLVAGALACVGRGGRAGGPWHACAG